MEDREANASFGIEFQSSNIWTTGYSRNYEFLPKNFPIASGVIVPQGVYSHQGVRTSYLIGPQRRLSGTFALSHGTLYGGTQTAATYSGRVSVIRQFAMEPSFTLNKVDLPFGDFATALVASRFNFTPNPYLIVSSLVQFNTADHSLNSSIRLRWEYAPRSELFVVYSDGRGRTLAGLRGLQNRSLAIKVTRLLRF